MTKNEKAFIFEFKVLDTDDDERTLEDTVANALAQIEENAMRQPLLPEGLHREISGSTVWISGTAVLDWRISVHAGSLNIMIVRSLLTRK